MSFGFPEFYSVFSGIIRNHKPQYVLAAWLVDFDGMNSRVPMDSPSLNRLVHNGSRAKEKFNDIKERLGNIKPVQLVEYFRTGMSGEYAIKSHPIVIRAFESVLDENLADIPETKNMLLKYATKDTMPEFLASLFFYSFTEGELLIPEVLANNLPEQLPRKFWLSRKGQEEKLRNLLDDGSKEIYIIGQGGLGKTEFITCFANENQEDFRFYFTTFKGTIRDTVIQLEFDDWEPEAVDPKTGRITVKPIDQQYKEKLHMLKKFDDTAVLIIDNFDGETDKLLGDPSFKELKGLNMRLIFTTRMPLKNKTYVEILPFSVKELLHLMHTYLEGSYSDEELIPLIEVVGCHTLLVDLIARLLSESLLGTTPGTILTALKDRKWESLREKVSSEYNRDDSQKTVLNHLLNLFNVSDLSEDASFILSCTALLPPEGFNSPLFMQCLGENEKWLDVVNDLRRTGWVDFNRQSTKISIHPLVREACLQNAATSPGWQKNESFIGEIASASHYPKSHKLALQLQAVLTQICLTIKPDNEYLDYSAEMHLMIGHLYNVLGNYQAAVEFIQMALLFRQDLPDTHINMVRTLSLLATVKQNLGEFSEACNLFEEVISLRQNGQGTETNPQMAPDYYNLCGALWDMGRYQESLAYGLKALQLANNDETATASNLCRSYCQLSRIYAELEDYQEQLNYAKKAFAYENQLSEDPLVRITIYGAYCLALVNNQDYPTACHYAEKLYKLCQKEVPAKHPLMATAYRMLSLTHAGLSNYEIAIEFADKEIALYATILTADHPDLGKCYFRKGNILNQMGAYSDALRCYEKARTIFEQVFPQEHPHFAKIQQAMKEAKWD